MRDKDYNDDKTRCCAVGVVVDILSAHKVDRDDIIVDNKKRRFTILLFDS
jgi:hypothetical protein